MSSEPMIAARNLGKAYQIYAAPQDRLKQSIVPRLQGVAASLARPFGSQIERRRYYRDFWALRDVSFTVNRGEAIGIIGRNGSGKSTLLQLVAGTLTPTSGELQLQGRVAALLELGAGFNPEFTGRENVRLNATLLGLQPDEIEAKFDDILAFADIGAFVDQPVRTYSSGMVVRLAFAISAHVDADLLIIDEALAVGDAFFAQKCMRWLHRFRETGTLLFVSHDTATVSNLCERAMWLDHGVQRAYGSAKEVCELYFATIYSESTGLGVDAVQPSKAAPAKPPSRQAAVNLPPPCIEVFEFNEYSAAFGTGAAEIVSVQIADAHGEPVSWIEGGEELQIVVRAVCHQDVESPIVGFVVKDRIGQQIFGDNTYAWSREAIESVPAGERLEARFTFPLPMLRSGEYVVSAAIASGTPAVHVQHHWMHDALAFKVHSGFTSEILLKVPMSVVSLEHRAAETV